MAYQKTTFDIVVIGGGVAGLTTALAFADQGERICLLDRGRLAGEASWAGAGILFPVYPWRYPEAVQDMAMRGRRLHPELAGRLLEETGIDTGYRRSGLLMLDEQGAAARWASANAEPYRQDVNSEALLFPEVAQIRNPRLCKALVELLREKPGVELRPDNAAVRIGRDARGTLVRTASGESLAARICVLCSGAWTSELTPDLEVRPVKGQMLLLRDEPGRWPNILFDGGRYLVPREDGLLLIGSTVEEAGFDRSTDEATIQGLREHFSARFPRIGKLPEVARWAGFRPATADGLPYVSPVPGCEGLFVNTGHFRNGLTMAPAAAELLLNITGHGIESPLDPSDYALSPGLTSSR